MRHPDGFWLDTAKFGDMLARRNRWRSLGYLAALPLIFINTEAFGWLIKHAGMQDWQVWLACIPFGLWIAWGHIHWMTLWMRWFPKSWKELR
jgi:hypothetical protein